MITVKKTINARLDVHVTGSPEEPVFEGIIDGMMTTGPYVGFYDSSIERMTSLIRYHINYGFQKNENKENYIKFGDNKYELIIKL